MSTALAVPAPSHSSPLRPRDHHDPLPPDHEHRHHRPSPLAMETSRQDHPRHSPSASSATRRAHASSSPATDAPSSAARAGPAVRNRDSRSPRAASGYPPQPHPQNGSSPNVPIIKKEHPSSPDVRPTSHPGPMSRPRPRRLDLSRGKNAQIPAAAATVGARPSAPGASRDGASSLSALHDVAAACLSPGFQTHDPSVQQQLARSMEMKEQQRQIIEARLHGKPAGEKGPDAGPHTGGLPNASSGSRRKGKPPGLSINAPSHHHFAGEPRVVRTAPLDQTFTGLRPGQNLSRHVLDRHPPPPSHLAPAGHPGPPSQPGNSLPPISSVLNSEPGAPGSSRHPPPPHYAAPSPGYPPLPASAGLPPPPPRSHPQAGPIAEPPGVPPSRQREFRSAEEAVRSLSGGREELLPKIVHYGGHQPPTPPSPRPGQSSAHTGPALRPEPDHRSASGRRRPRDEYERDYDERAELEERERRYFGWEEERGRRGGPAMAGHPPQPHPGYAPYARPVDSPDAVRRKKDEFMSLCSRAWDLLHS